MTKLFCDKCGEEITRSNKIEGHIVVEIRSGSKDTGHVMGAFNIGQKEKPQGDFCVGCLCRALEKFINSKSTNLEAPKQ